jgi:hypothetical protein
MITPQDGQRGVIGQQHGLTRLTETLEALVTGQTQQQARDTAIQETLTRLTHQVGRVTIWSRHLLIAVGTLGGLTVLLAGLVGWQVWHPPEQSYARVLGSLDATLVQSWGSLPKGIQEQLRGAYEAVGLRSPGMRQPARGTR